MRITTFILVTFTLFCVSTSLAVTFDWAVVGNPGNTNDVHGDGYGGVDHIYSISKTEITNAQYTEFLNAVATFDSNGLYHTSMGTNPFGGIVRSGQVGNYMYDVKPDAQGQGMNGSKYTYADKPVVYVSFFDAMRFVNWLENSQPTGVQDANTTEAGVYIIGNGVNETRASDATYFLPTANEWYKAAYHKNDGTTDNYWDYPTSSDLAPNNNFPSSDTGNSANFQDGDYTTGNAIYRTTDVGAYLFSISPYGTFDQGGNVYEWNETVVFSSHHSVRGGDADGNLDALFAGNMSSEFPIEENPSIGFRVASAIPEPSVLSLVGMGVVVGLGVRRRMTEYLRGAKF